MADLITAAEFKTFKQIEVTDDDTLIADLVTKVSADIEAWTQRSWTQAERTEYLDGDGRALRVKFPPIAHVRSVIDTLSRRLAVTNPYFDGNTTGWTLGANWALYQNMIKHTAGSTAATVQSLTHTQGQVYCAQLMVVGRTAGDVTLAIGNNSGTARSTNESFDELIYIDDADGTQQITITPSSDFDGSVDRVLVELVTPEAQDSYRFDSGSGLIGRIPSRTSDFWYGAAGECGELLWGSGWQRWRVQYLGGFTEVPEAVKLLACKMVAVLYDQDNPAVVSQQEGDAATQYGDGVARDIRRMRDRFSELSF